MNTFTEYHKLSVIAQSEQRHQRKTVGRKIERTKEAILNHFKSSAFNACKHKEIPTIEIGEPLKLHISSNAKPPETKVKFHTVPIHLEKEVKEQLAEDVKLGVIEKVADLAKADEKPTEYRERVAE